MNDSVDPLRAVQPVASGGDRRRGRDRREGPTADAGPLYSDPPSASAPPPPEQRRSGLSEVFAQLLGQGQRRGLKGGQPVLDTARTTYLGTEYSGPADRRPRSGKVDREI